MKQLFTLFALAFICLLPTTSQAQLSQNFDTNGSYANNCWSFAGFFLTTQPSEVINGTSSLYTNPPTNNNGSGTRDVTSPYLNLTSTAFTVAFNYKLSSALNGQATRQIEVGLFDRDGVFTSLDVIGMNRSTLNQTQTNLYNKDFTLTSTGVKRLVLKFSGSQGDGNTRMIVDDLYTTASARYSYSSTCNSAPVEGNDSYNAPSYAPFHGSSVLQNDSDPNTEALTLSVISSPDGTVSFNADGTFIFTPNSSFTGSTASFTYSVGDNGYDPLSATATVNIYFPVTSILPLKLINFSGRLVDGKAHLDWNVSQNEEGSYFEVQRSLDGKNFKQESILFTTTKTGTEQYRYKVDAKNGASGYYRLKIVSLDQSIHYSPIIYLKESTEAGAMIALQQNPVSSTLTFSLRAEKKKTLDVAIVDLAGVKRYAGTVVAQQGLWNQTIRLDNNIGNGIYFLLVKEGNSTQAIKFIKN